MEDQKYKIRDALPIDAVGIVRIYNYYIANTIITFEEDAVSVDIINERIKKVQVSKLPWLVAEQDGKVLGYSYSSKWKGRGAYRYLRK